MACSASWLSREPQERGEEVDGVGGDGGVGGGIWALRRRRRDERKEDVDAPKAVDDILGAVRGAHASGADELGGDGA